jgi:hypothetical protein
MAEKTDWAWLAGMIDGEGCVQITTGRERTSHFLHVSVEGIDQKVIEHIGTMTNLGSICNYQGKGWNRKRMWRWSVASTQAEKVLTEALPYLIGKRDQAEIALQFQSRKGSLYNRHLPNEKRRLSRDEIDAREEMRQKLVALHQ